VAEVQTGDVIRSILLPGKFALNPSTHRETIAHKQKPTGLPRSGKLTSRCTRNNALPKRSAGIQAHVFRHMPELASYAFVKISDRYLFKPGRLIG